MPRTFKLTWQQGKDGRSGRWRKKYNGKVHYFPGGRGKSDREAYDIAIACWEKLKVEIDAAAPRPHQLSYDAAIEEWEKVLAFSTRYRELEMAELAAKKLKSLRQRLSNPVLERLRNDDRFESLFEPPTVSLPDSILSPMTEQEIEILKVAAAKYDSGVQPINHRSSDVDQFTIDREIWKDRIALQDRRAAKDSLSLGAKAERFLADKQQEAERGFISKGRANTLGIHLSDFVDWLGKTTSVLEITGDTLLRYRSDLLDQRRGKGKHVKEMSAIKHYLDSAKAFVRWLWRTEAIPSLPRVLDGKAKELQVPVPGNSAVIFSLDEIRLLLAHATDRTKLYILLMLNCGMTQKDISDLQIDEVDWNEGRIIRKRSKTKGHKQTPTVNYQLWPEVFRLLQEQGKTTGNGRVLLNSNGEPLWLESFDSSKKYAKNDNIKNAFERLRLKLKVKKSLKSLKKSSATLLRNEERFRGLEDLFLGHAPQRMSDKHYTQVPQALFDRAIRWLGEYYGVIEKPDAETATHATAEHAPNETN